MWGVIISSFTGSFCPLNEIVLLTTTRTRTIVMFYVPAMTIVPCRKFRGEHSDARELAALYVTSGVPVYPQSRGFSYQTLTWRMSVEAQDMCTTDEGRSTRHRRETPGGITHGDDTIRTSAANAVRGVESSVGTANSIGRQKDHNDNSHEALFLDPFYSKRDEWRERGGCCHPEMTYLEEKCLFWQQKTTEVENSDWQMLVERRRHSLTNSVALRPPSALRQSSLPVEASLPPRRSASSSNLITSTCLGDRSTAFLRHRPHCLVRIHRHLADGHLLGRPTVNGQGGRIKTASLSLGADFFHPLFSSKLFRSAALGYANSRTRDVTLSKSGISTGSSTGEDNARMLAPQDAGEETNAHSLINIDAADVELEVYSSFSMGISKAQGTCTQHQLAKEYPSLLNLRSRVIFYQRKLDSHLAHYQSIAFDECLLDFWDEFLPSTKGVHFHDGHTPVPRMFDLHGFLTNPCPKRYGTVQCEIERIKITGSKNGVNVKGRLFPSYQYRLFIRDKREDEQTTSEHGDSIPRCDTVLMIAKYKNKKTKEMTMTSSTGKRGVNNYHLFMPTDRDIQSHFLEVNDASVCNGSRGPDQRLFPSAGKVISREVGRLQSNFIGTEFQIFAPSSSKRQNQSVGLSQSFKGCSRIGSFDSANSSDMEEASSIVSHDTNSSLHSSPQLSIALGHAEIQNGLILSQRSRSRRNSNTSSFVSGSEEVVDKTTDPDVSSTMGQSRRRSWPTLRYSRRAIANDTGDNAPAARDFFSKKRFVEEEVGVITYTANLLGNRPRIMDVCIPKISDGGSVSPSWKSNIDAAFEMGMDESMMSRFKQLQQFSSQQENSQVPMGQNNSEGGGNRGMSPDEFGLLALQNRPPWWNAELGAFVLNFGGRVSVASVKNFQLCERSNQEHVMLQFGRIEGRHSFTMDFQHPLSAIQAFSM